MKSPTFPALRWGWEFLERTRIFSEIQFTTHFIEFFVVETKRFVGSFVNILTRQTCGQRSSRAAESKRRALGHLFIERICYMFLISKCREPEIWVCAKLRDWRLENRSAIAKLESDFSCIETLFFSRKSPLRRCTLFPRPLITHPSTYHECGI